MQTNTRLNIPIHNFRSPRVVTFLTLSLTLHAHTTLHTTTSQLFICSELQNLPCKWSLAKGAFRVTHFNIQQTINCILSNSRTLQSWDLQIIRTDTRPRVLLVTLDPANRNVTVVAEYRYDRTVSVMLGSFFSSSIAGRPSL